MKNGNHQADRSNRQNKRQVVYTSSELPVDSCNKMTKTAIYVRVSTNKQEADNQLIQLRGYAKAQDWEVFKEYEDIVTGKEVNELNRPAFKEMFSDAHKRNFDIVLFWDLSRFSRAGTLYTLKKLNELEGYGVNWHSYSDKYLSSLGEFKDVVISIMAVISKQERLKISERTKAGFYRDEYGVTRSVKHNKAVGKRSKDKKKRHRRFWKKPKSLA